MHAFVSTSVRIPLSQLVFVYLRPYSPSPLPKTVYILYYPKILVFQILEIKKDTERGSGEGTSMELTSKGAGTYW